MHYLYIIYSTTKDVYYIGETHDLKKRIYYHNIHAYSKSFTKIANDCVEVLNFECKTKKDALYLEKFIKRMKSKKFILKLIEKPSVLNDILLKR